MGFLTELKQNLGAAVCSMIDKDRTLRTDSSPTIRHSARTPQLHELRFDTKEDAIAYLQSNSAEFGMYSGESFENDVELGKDGKWHVRRLKH